MERVEVHPSKLPLEILGMIFLKIDEDNPIEELKKCRLVSPRFYKAVQDLFQDEFSQKYCTQFDGLKYNYTKSRTFGMNIFGSYKLNFPTVKISRSEYYLMKTWLEKLISANLQTLELKDNQLDWKEFILLLKKFPAIVNLKFIQTSENMEVAEQILKLFQIKFQPNGGGYKSKVKEQLGKSEKFLPNLKNFQAHTVHIKVLNILSFIISCAHCQLESFSIKIDLDGVCQSSEMILLKQFKIEEKLPVDSLESLNHFKKFSKWLKNLEIKILYSNKGFNPPFKIQDYIGYCIVYKSILQMFLKPDKLKKFTNIENLKIKVLTKDDFVVKFIDEKHKIGLFEFVNNQKNLQKFALSPSIKGPSQFELEHNSTPTSIQDILKNLMVTPKSTFEYYSISGQGLGLGLEPILGFSENLSKLYMVEHYFDSTLLPWRFSNPEIKVFRNCTSLAIGFVDLNWDDFEIQNMIQKFPNLKKLAIICPECSFLNIEQTFTNNNLQLIIKHYKDLKSLYLYLTKSYDFDSGLTGLSLEAIEARKENPGLPIEPQDRVGLPICHLKDLKSLVIKNEDMNQISDISAHHAFDKMPNLRNLDLKNTNITQNGFETILEKTKSKNLNIVQLNPTIYDDGDTDWDSML